ncbi:hypothetical protein JOD18_002836 [Gracilibacillus alcaliphilus]|nr:hypothetical protein [Gracilibacillus alcaliphilus]
MPQSCAYHVTSDLSFYICEDTPANNKYQKRKKQTKQLLRRTPDHQLMDLKIDYAFKQLFGNEQNEAITRVFLNAFLAESGRPPIQTLLFQNIEIGGEHERDKQARRDVLIRTMINNGSI